MNNNNTVVINTKIKKVYLDLLNRFCKMKGLTHHQLLQNCVETLIKYTVEGHNLTPEIEEAMSMFEHCEGWKDAFNLCDPSANPEVVFAVYFLQDEEGKKGIRSVLVEKPYFGQWLQTENVTEIFERAFNTLLPGLYRQLRNTGIEMGTSSVVETITKLISLYGDDADAAVYRELFQDANRSEFGLKPHEGTPFRRKHHKDVESQTGLDFKPFDQEP